MKTDWFWIFDTSNFESNVARGAAWLDENYPGWEGKIDLSIFDIGDCTACILGQTISHLAYSIWSEKNGVGWATAHGFAGETEIENLWTSLIKERFDTGNLSGMPEE